MKRKHVLWSILVVLLLGLSGCGRSDGANAGASPAAQQFLAERGGTPGPASGTAEVAHGDMPVMGTVEEIGDGELVVKDALDGTSSTLRISADTKVKKEVEASLADLQVGAAIVAMGTRSGDTFEPQFINIGVDGGPRMINRSGSQSPQGSSPNVVVRPPAGGAEQPSMGGQAVMGEPLRGTVQQVDGNQVTVKDAAGAQVTMEVAGDVKMSKQVDAAPDDVQAGQTITAKVTRDGAEITATEIRILPTPAES